MTDFGLQPQQTASIPNRPERCFFILAQGRTGTAFLANLLNQDLDADVAHEPWEADVHLLGLTRCGCFSRTTDALLRERFRARFAQRSTARIYGEVNSYLRYSGAWLQQELGASLIHVARDGRSFVRSAWLRDVHTSAQRQLPIVPDDSDPYSARWHQMDRFARICWIWRDTNDLLLDSVGISVRLEDILSDYCSLEDQVLIPTGVHVEIEQWRQAVQNPRNTSQQYLWRQRLKRFIRGRHGARPREALPHWSEWTRSQTETFWEICGDVMHRLGYPR